MSRSELYAVSTDRSPALPEDLDTPDVGFLAGAGVYVAALLATLSTTATLAAGGTAASLLGGLTSAVTIGIVAGAFAASRFAGLPERLGRSRRKRLLPFAPAAAFALLVPLPVAVETVPSTASVGLGLGAVLTGLCAAGIHSMARTRYADAVTQGSPRATIRWLKPNLHRRWYALAVVCFALAIVPFSFTGVGGLERARPARAFWWVGIFGVVWILIGRQYQRLGRRSVGGEANEESIWTPRRRVMGFEHSITPVDDQREMLPELAVYDAGLVITRPGSRRLVPRSSITDVRVTDDRVIIERTGWRDIRCDRAVIDDVEPFAETLAEQCAALRTRSSV